MGDAGRTTGEATRAAGFGEVGTDGTRGVGVGAEMAKGLVIDGVGMIASLKGGVVSEDIDRGRIVAEVGTGAASGALDPGPATGAAAEAGARGTAEAGAGAAAISAALATVAGTGTAGGKAEAGAGAAETFTGAAISPIEGVFSCAAGIATEGLSLCE